MEQYKVGGIKDKVRVQAKISSSTDSSELDREYFDIYSEAKSLPLINVQAILEEMGEQYKAIHKSLDNKNNQFYIQINQTKGDLIMSEAGKKESNLNLQNAKFSGGVVNAETINGEQVGGNITNYAQKHKSKPVSTANVDSIVKTILILAVNPRNTSTLRLDEEVREIDNGLQRAKKRELFEIKQRWAVRVQELHQSLLDFKPQIVHFSGHGVENEGLALENESGNTQLISTEALSNLFKLFASHIECVVLNACYSETQAVAIAKHIPYVIGMNKAIGDKAAIKFSTGFYNALLSGESVEFAYKLGCNVVQLDGIPEHLTPVLKKIDKS
jgi:CHAT domain